MRALASNGEATAMSQPAITADVHQTLDIHLNALSEVALDLALGVDDGANLV